MKYYKHKPEPKETKPEDTRETVSTPSSMTDDSEATPHVGGELAVGFYFSSTNEH